MGKPTGKRRLKARAQVRDRQASVEEIADAFCCNCGWPLGFDQATVYDADGSARLYCLDCFPQGLARYS